VGARWAGACRKDAHVLRNPFVRNSGKRRTKARTPPAFRQSRSLQADDRRCALPEYRKEGDNFDPDAPAYVPRDGGERPYTSDWGDRAFPFNGAGAGRKRRVFCLFRAKLEEVVRLRADFDGCSTVLRPSSPNPAAYRHIA